MNTIDLVRALWYKLFSTRIIISAVFFVSLINVVSAQDGEFDVISTTGKIIDKRNGRELQVGDKVSFQTDLEFGSLHDRAVLLNPEKSKYFLEFPKSYLGGSQLTITSNQALVPVKGRPALSTSTRGASVMVTGGLSKKTLKEYLSIDTFTIIGAKFVLPVSKKDAQKFDLVLRYEVGNVVEEYVSTDFSISKNDLKIQGNKINECFVLLKQGDKIEDVKAISLFFVDKPQLHREFNSLLKALNQNKSDKNASREIIRQYCTDVYGMIDRNTLDATINEFLK
jgi:hypothetical protein